MSEPFKPKEVSVPVVPIYWSRPDDPNDWKPSGHVWKRPRWLVRLVIRWMKWKATR